MTRAGDAALGEDWEKLTAWATASVNLDRKGPAKSARAWHERTAQAVRRLLGYAQSMGRPQELAEALANGPLLMEFVAYSLDHRCARAQGEPRNPGRCPLLSAPRA